MSELDKKLQKLKLVRCARCLHEASVRWVERIKKVCPKCLASESILEGMHLVPSETVHPDETEFVESDWADWVDEDDGYKQQKLQTG